MFGTRAHGDSQHMSKGACSHSATLHADLSQANALTTIHENLQQSEVFHLKSENAIRKILASKKKKIGFGNFSKKYFQNSNCPKNR